MRAILIESEGASPRLVEDADESLLTGEVALDDDAALKWAREDFLRMERERRVAALRRFEQRRRGREEGGVVILDDSDDDAPPAPVRHGDAGQGCSRDGRVKEEKADGDDGGEDGDYSAFSDFFF